MVEYMYQSPLNTGILFGGSVGYKAPGGVFLAGLPCGYAVISGLHGNGVLNLLISNKSDV